MVKMAVLSRPASGPQNTIKYFTGATLECFKANLLKMSHKDKHIWQIIIRTWV
jgi:hypothetical protein